jgi:two-component system chemotaxis response regulator CheB
MSTASDPFTAAERIMREVPDVMLLDIEMPRMDGLTFLRRIMSQRPIPVVICSSLTEQGSDTWMQALEAGAVDVVTKPRIGTSQFLQDSRMRICDAVKAAAQAKLRRGRRIAKPVAIESKLMADVIIPSMPLSRTKKANGGDRIACIGASTGGTEALRVVLESLPANAPGTVIVQHMPEKFTAAFARRLNGLCAVEVKEAENGDIVEAGRVLIAPGNHHMMLQRIGSHYTIEIKDGPPVCRHRPSVDVLFRSAAQMAGSNAIGVLLTGMGDDGARGLLEMKMAGGITIAQDEDTSVVFGMPKEAIQRGAAQMVLPLEKIAAEILNWYQKAPLPCPA